jgi:hypothetical protein
MLSGHAERRCARPPGAPDGRPARGPRHRRAGLGDGAVRQSPPARDGVPPGRAGHRSRVRGRCEGAGPDRATAVAGGGRGEAAAGRRVAGPERAGRACGTASVPARGKGWEMRGIYLHETAREVIPAFRTSVGIAPEDACPAPPERHAGAPTLATPPSTSVTRLDRSWRGSSPRKRTPRCCPTSGPSSRKSSSSLRPERGPVSRGPRVSSSSSTGGGGRALPRHPRQVPRPAVTARPPRALRSLLTRRRFGLEPTTERCRPASAVTMTMETLPQVDRSPQSWSGASTGMYNVQCVYSVPAPRGGSMPIVRWPLAESAGYARQPQGQPWQGAGPPCIRNHREDTSGWPE